jgi:hypothetical protein
MNRFLSVVDSENPRFIQQLEEIRRVNSREIKPGIKIFASGTGVWDALVRIFYRIMGLTIQIEEKGQIYCLGRRSAEYFVRRSNIQTTGLRESDLQNSVLSYEQIAQALRNILEDQEVRKKLGTFTPSQIYTGIFSQVAIVPRQTEASAHVPLRVASTRSKSGRQYTNPQGLPPEPAPLPVPQPQPVVVTAVSATALTQAAAPVMQSTASPSSASPSADSPRDASPVTSPAITQTPITRAQTTPIHVSAALQQAPGPLPKAPVGDGIPERPGKLFLPIKSSINMAKYVTRISASFADGGINSISLLDSKKCPLPCLALAIYMQQNPIRFNFVPIEDFTNAMTIIMKNLSKLPLLEQFWLYDIVASETCLPTRLQSEVVENEKPNQAVMAMLRDIIVANYTQAKEKSDAVRLIGYMKKDRARCAARKEENAVKFYDDFAKILNVSLIS